MSHDLLQSHEPLQRDLLGLIADLEAEEDPRNPTHPWRLDGHWRPRVEALARRVIAFQLDHNAAYARYIERSTATERPGDLLDLPPVPTDAFKRAALCTFPPETAVACFHSSGTTRGDPGRHYLRSLALATASLRAPFRAFTLPELPAGGRFQLAVLAPEAAQAPHSSLCFMLDVVRREFGTAASRCYVDPTTGLDLDALCSDLQRASDRDEPVFLLGPSFSFVHLLDDRPGLRLQLPPGSRLFETGGFKGQSRSVPREELHAGLVAALGLEPAMIVAEYGMSELSSQLYEPSLRVALAGADGWVAPALQRAFVPPPWCLPRVLDPTSLRPVPLGQVGQLAMLDLANLTSVASIVTGDLGRFLTSDELGLPATDAWTGLPPGAVALQLHGRAAQATPKGCSIAIDALLSGEDDNPWG